MVQPLLLLVFWMSVPEYERGMASQARIEKVAGNALLNVPALWPRVDEFAPTQFWELPVSPARQPIDEASVTVAVCEPIWRCSE